MSDKRKKTRQKLVRFEPADWLTIEEAAAREGRTTEAFIRHFALKEAAVLLNIKQKK